MIDYKIYDLAKKVRATAASTIKAESEVIQTNESRVREAMEVINLCNAIIAEFDGSNKSPVVRSRTNEDHHPR
jgi:hypothetical protein